MFFNGATAFIWDSETQMREWPWDNFFCQSSPNQVCTPPIRCFTSTWFWQLAAGIQQIPPPPDTLPFHTPAMCQSSRSGQRRGQSALLSIIEGNGRNWNNMCDFKTLWRGFFSVAADDAAHTEGNTHSCHLDQLYLKSIFLCLVNLSCIIHFTVFQEILENCHWI